VDDEFSGTVVEKMQRRKAELTDMRPSGAGKTRTFSALARPDRLSWRIPVRHARHGHHEPPVREVWPPQGPIEGRPNGVLISNATGEAVAYALNSLEDRGAVRAPAGQGL
jgi:GTP-binding protein